MCMANPKYLALKTPQNDKLAVETCSRVTHLQDAINSCVDGQGQ
jgi:hypothetical protein